MSDMKTAETDADPALFLSRVENRGRAEDAQAVMEIMARITGQPPRMWGDSIIGFGTYRYKYASGRQAEWFLTGFAPRKQNLTLYIMSGFENYEQLLGQLGKHKTGKSCLYINKLEDINLDVLREMVKESVNHMVETNK